MKKLLFLLLLLPSLALAQPIGSQTYVNNSTGGDAVNVQDGGNVITVDGTVTSTPSGTQDVDVTGNTIGLCLDTSVDGIEALLTTIDSDTNVIQGAVAAGQMQVDIVADGAGLCLDASVDGVEALLTTIDADTGTISTNTTNIASDTDSLAVVDNGVALTAQRVTIASDSTGQLTCNAGTNLNTSALALDTSVDGIEALLGTIDADTSSIAGEDFATETTLGTIDTSLNNIEAGYAAEAAALGSGVLLQGDDGTDRQNINVDATTGDLQVDVTNSVTITPSGTQDVDVVANSIGLALDTSVDGVEALLTGIDSDTNTIQGAVAAGQMQVDIVADGAGLALDTSVDGIEALLGTIDTDTGNIDTSLNAIEAGYAAEGAALGSGVLLQGDDGTDRHNVAVDTTGNLQVDIVADGAGLALDTSVDGIEALLTGIDSDTNTIQGAVAAGQMQVDIVADGAGLALDTSVDGIEALLGTIDADTGNIDTNTTDVPNVIGTDGTAGPTRVLSMGGTESGGNIQEIAVDATGNLQVDLVADAAGLALDTSVDGIEALLGTIDTDTGNISTDTTVIAGWDNAAGDGASISGDTAHDATDDSSEPVKIGGRSTDYHPNTEDEQGQTETAEDDRTNAAYNLRGEAIEGVNGFYHLFDGTFPDTGLDGQYDDSPTSSTSESVECWNYRYATVGMEIDSTLTPTVIQIIVEVSPDNTTWFPMKSGALSYWTYDDTFVASIENVSLTFPIAAAYCRVVVETAGTTSSAFFTVDDSFIYLRN